MAIVKFDSSVTLSQAAKLILAAPSNRYMLLGEPGIGKSSIMGELSRQLPDYEVSYMDCASLDLGDIAMPWIDKDTGVTRYAPNSRFKLHMSKPVIIMLDEFSKAMAPVKNMLHPLLESHNPRLGDISIDPRSIIFLTGNLSSDGVGDVLLSHTRNRIIPINVRKSDSKGWLMWAANNDIDPVVMAFVDQYPQCMASYTDEGQENNHLIFQPKQSQSAFISPRSLERASNVLKAREGIDSDSIIAALKGAIGEAGARELQAFVEYQDQLPKWDEIISKPDEAKLPDGAGASSVLIYRAVQMVDKQNITPFMRYLARFAAEWQACFAISVARNPQKQSVAFSSKSFADWVQANEDLL